MTATRQRTSGSKIYTILRREIITGRHRPAARLAVGRLADRFGTSVSPVRDALQKLSQEGLVTIKPRSGYFVTHMTLKELQDLLELREILETAALDRAAGRIDHQQLDRLAHLHDRYTGDDPASYDRYTQENRQFHVALAEASGNRELARQIGHLLDRLARFMVMTRTGKTMPDSHAQILSALRKADGAAARRALLQELRTARRKILERVMDEESGRWRLN
ncbi:MAG: GntR family transcriptional regulator [Desulfosarcinaceae bacterium]|nr:GntR family transcriptional regulator [Desulfosarcinaceae bacterium]